ncbi:hypothetical protein HK100_011340 [Physocladia obscura]|uniref:PH domain-containing protein n=1 Tax=Physocladia obscura TaxID=109957 RepID=A0AAD5T9G8_9FUNG|nr:hypothetical protein HK100_011340 [Physocladia obscura]
MPTNSTDGKIVRGETTSTNTLNTISAQLDDLLDSLATNSRQEVVIVSPVVGSVATNVASGRPSMESSSTSPHASLAEDVFRRRSAESSSQQIIYTGSVKKKPHTPAAIRIGGYYSGVTLADLQLSLSTTSGFLSIKPNNISMESVPSQWIEQYFILEAVDCTIHMFTSSTEIFSRPIASLQISSVTVNPTDNILILIGIAAINTAATTTTTSAAVIASTDSHVVAWNLLCSDATSLKMWHQSISRILHANRNNNRNQSKQLWSGSPQLSLDSAVTYSNPATPKVYPSLETSGFHHQKQNANHTIEAQHPTTVSPKFTSGNIRYVGGSGNNPYLVSMWHTNSASSTGSVNGSKSEEREAQMKAMHEEYMSMHKDAMERYRREKQAAKVLINSTENAGSQEQQSQQIPDNKNDIPQLMLAKPHSAEKAGKDGVGEKRRKVKNMQELQLQDASWQQYSQYPSTSISRNVSDKLASSTKLNGLIDSLADFSFADENESVFGTSAPPESRALNFPVARSRSVGSNIVRKPRTHSKNATPLSPQIQSSVTLGQLQLSNYAIMSGYLTKLEPDGSSIPRFFLLTEDSQLYAFKTNFDQSAVPVATLNVCASCVANIDASDNSFFVLQVPGINQTWTLTSDEEQTTLLWTRSINRVVENSHNLKLDIGSSSHSRSNSIRSTATSTATPSSFRPSVSSSIFTTASDISARHVSITSSTGGVSSYSGISMARSNSMASARSTVSIEERQAQMRRMHENYVATQQMDGERRRAEFLAKKAEIERIRTQAVADESARVASFEKQRKRTQDDEDTVSRKSSELEAARKEAGERKGKNSKGAHDLTFARPKGFENDVLVMCHVPF